MLNSLTSAFKSFYSSLKKTFAGWMNKTILTPEDEQLLYATLLKADTGVPTSKKIVEQLKSTLQPGQTVGTALQKILLSTVEPLRYTHEQAPVILLVGINGSGKTTTAAKLAYYYAQKGERVLLVAADTFRAAAQEQLAVWSERLAIPCIQGAPMSDPSATVFQGCTAFVSGSYDRMIIDTAGRLHTKDNLMKELEKMRRVLEKKLPGKEVATLLTLDSMLGQTSCDQAKIFNESTNLQGIILTKTDGTGKGGMLIAIADTLHIPIAYITFGEQMEALAPFDAHTFVDTIIEQL